MKTSLGRLLYISELPKHNNNSNSYIIIIIIIIIILLRIGTAGGHLLPK